MGNTKNNVMNNVNGFCVMVNLYIIRYMYSHMKRTMAEGIRKQDLYDGIMKISRQRFYRICSGERFRITREDKERLSQIFRIGEDYFMPDGRMIEIYQLEEDDWHSFFYMRYHVPKYDEWAKKAVFERNPEKKKKKVDDLLKKREEKVAGQLKQITEKGFIENHYGTDSPLYRISYYYKNGRGYEEENQLAKFIRELARLKISDWDAVIGNEVKLREYAGLLEKHHKYIQAALTCIESRKE